MKTDPPTGPTFAVHKAIPCCTLKAVSKNLRAGELLGANSHTSLRLPNLSLRVSIELEPVAFHRGFFPSQKRAFCVHFRQRGDNPHLLTFFLLFEVMNQEATNYDKSSFGTPLRHFVSLCFSCPSSFPIAKRSEAWGRRRCNGETLTALSGKTLLYPNGMRHSLKKLIYIYI